MKFRRSTGLPVTAVFGAMLVLLGGTFPARANGIDGNGVGARAMAMGGADVAWASDPLGAMGANPAGLGFLAQPELDLGAIGGAVEGHFDKPGVSSGVLDSSPAALPEGAFGMPIGKWPVSVGLSFVPESMSLANWHYADPAGGLAGTTSYGYQQDKSEIINLRIAAGLAAKVTRDLSFGASLGLVYNENHLITPYTFQNLQPGPGGPANSGLNGAKTLLNLQTSGVGVNAQLGALYRATPDLQLGVSYETPTEIHSTGGASGDPSVQFGQAPGSLPFHYDATVRNTLPQQVKAGLSWKFQPKWRLALQLDWIGWGGAFNSLPLSFRNGNNATVNGSLGSSFSESIPLNWKDEFVYRTGLEYEVVENLTLRAGYCYGASPVPDSTLSPLTAAIPEQTVTAGIGYRWRQVQIDLAYQYDLPVTQSVGSSSLLSGEYSNTSTEVSAHTVALTTSVRF